VALREEGVVHGVALADGVGLGPVEADVVELAEVLPLGEPLVLVQLHPERPRGLAGGVSRSLGFFFPGAPGQAKLVPTTPPIPSVEAKSSPPSLISTWSPK